MSDRAPIYSSSEDARARAEAAAWARFTATATPAEFSTAWLTILCGQVAHARAAMLLLDQGANGAYVPVAIWPDPKQDMRYLGAAAERALNERAGIGTAPDGKAGPRADEPAHVGYPIEVDGRLHGAIVIDIGPGPLPELQRSLRSIHWASAWLIDQFRKAQIEERDQRLARVT